LQAPFAQALDGRAMAQRVAQARRAQGFRAAGVIPKITLGTHRRGER